MSDANPTPGPWFIARGLHGERVLSNNAEPWTGSNAKVIVRLDGSHGIPQGEREANYRLLASAPRLEALEAEVARLREALVQYGDHETGCVDYRNVHGYGCSCGFRAALAGQPLHPTPETLDE